MPPPPRNQLASTELGNRLSELQARHPDRPGATAIERWLLRHYDVEVSSTSIRKAHIGEVDPTACGVDLLAGLAAFYDVDPSALGRFAERRINSVLAMAGAATGGPNAPGGQGIPSTGCYAESPGQVIDLATRRAPEVPDVAHVAELERAS